MEGEGMVKREVKMPQKILIATEEELIEMIRNEFWDKGRVCAACFAERNDKGVYSGSKAVDIFTAMQKKKAKNLPRGTCICTNCAFSQVRRG